MDFVLAGIACIGWVTWLPDHGASEEDTKVLVQVSQEHARKAVSGELSLIIAIATHYWFDEVPLAGLFIINGTAPPSSKKLTETPDIPPMLVELRPPSKYGRRLICVPL